jgi:GTPase SAR1 family protein
MRELNREKLLHMSDVLMDLVKDDDTIVKTVIGIEERLKNFEFNLVLLGQFKRGKSTLANCFLGKDILPSGVLPLTSIVTEVRFGSNEEIHVYFTNNKKFIYPAKKLHEFVTEKYNPKNRKEVKRVVVFYKSDFLKNNVILIDTPGIGSTLLHNTKLTQDYLPNCDAAVMIISADSPLSNDEVEFIKSIRQYASKIFFVLNKSDYVSKREVNEMVLHIKSEILKFGIDTKIIPVSSKIGLAGKVKHNKTLLKNSGILQLENMLIGFLSKEKGNTLLESANLKINSISKSLYNRLQSEYSASNMTVKTINEKSEELLYSGSLDSEFEDMMLQIDNDMDNAKEDLIKAVHNSTTADINKNRKKSNFTDYVNSLIDKHIKAECIKWWRMEDKKIISRLSEIEKRYAYLINDMNRRIKDLSSHILNFTHKPILPRYKTSFRTCFYFETEGFGQGSFMMPSISILPQGIQRKRILSNLEEKVMHNVATNLGKIRYDYQQRLEKGNEDFKDVLLKALDGTRREIEAGLKKGSNIAKLTIEKKMEIKKELSRKLSVLSGIIKETE